LIWQANESEKDIEYLFVTIYHVVDKSKNICHIKNVINFWDTYRWLL